MFLAENVMVNVIRVYVLLLLLRPAFTLTEVLSSAVFVIFW